MFESVREKYPQEIAACPCPLTTLPTSFEVSLSHKEVAFSRVLTYAYALNFTGAT